MNSETTIIRAKPDSNPQTPTLLGLFNAAKLNKPAQAFSRQNIAMRNLHDATTVIIDTEESKPADQTVVTRHNAPIVEACTLYSLIKHGSEFKGLTTTDEIPELEQLNDAELDDDSILELTKKPRCDIISATKSSSEPFRRVPKKKI